MPTLTIGFSRSKSWFRPIGWFIGIVNKLKIEGELASHTFGEFKSESLERDLVYEAHGPGVNFVGNIAFEKRAKVLKRFYIPITAAQNKTILQFCVDHSGDPYARLQLVGILWVKFVYKLTGKKVKNPFTKGQICTETIIRLLQLLDIEMQVDPDVADLNDVYKALEKHCATSR